MASKSSDSASVIECLNELWPDFHLTIAQQMDPTSDIAIRFYEKFICYQLQIEIGKLQQILVQQSSCPEAFSDILNIYALYTCTDTVIKKLGLTGLELKLTNLISPTRKTFRLPLLLLSHCVMYAAGMQDAMDEIKKEVFEMLKNRGDMREKIEELKEKINNNIILHVQRSDKIKELKKRNAIQKQLFESESEKLEQAKIETKNAKSQYLQMKDEEEKLTTELNDLTLTHEKLKSNVVDDHDAIVSENARLKKKRDELLAESELDEFDKMMQQKMQNITAYQENLNIVCEFLKTEPLSKLREKYELLDNINADSKLIDNEIKVLQKQEHDHYDALQEIKAINKSMNQKLNKHANDHNEWMEHYDKEKIKLQDELKQILDYKNNTLELIQSLHENIRQISGTSRHYEQLTEKQNAYYNQKYKEILDLKAQLDHKKSSLIDKVAKNMYKK